jgi:hypothetical protein
LESTLDLDKVGVDVPAANASVCRVASLLILDSLPLGSLNSYRQSTTSML